MRYAAAVFLLFAASNAAAAHESRRVIVPIAGNVKAAGGAEYSTTLWITNRTTKPLHARVSFLVAGQANPDPIPADVELAAEQTLQFENVTETLLRQPGKSGALLIEADGAIACSARLASTPAGATAAASQGGGFAAIPIELAIPRGGSTLLQGAGSGTAGAFRYNVHLVETNRSAVQAIVSLLDANGREVGRQSVLLRELEAMTIPVSRLAASPPAEATVRIRVTKGSGKLVAAGSQIAAMSNDPTAFAMAAGDVPETAVPMREIVAYVAAALAIAIAALVRAAPLIRPSGTFSRREKDS